MEYVRLAILAGACYMTWSLTSDFYIAKAEAEAGRRAEKQLEFTEKVSDALGILTSKFIEAQKKERVRVKVIEKEVERVVQSDPVYSNPVCVLPDDGVRLYNAAAAGVQLESPAGADAAVPFVTTPAPAPANDGRTTPSRYGGVRAISPVPTRP